MTETIEYRTVDKTDWPRGPWDDEPDKIQWQDAHTGLACLIVRGPCGALCGYVGVGPGHPWHGQSEESVGHGFAKLIGEEPEDYVDVHGGLTFSGGCEEGPDPSNGICHVPAPGQPDTVWWLGFDCGHLGDLIPNAPSELSLSGILNLFGNIAEMMSGARSPEGGDVYRDLAFVRAECAKLAGQAAEAAA